MIGVFGVQRGRGVPCVAEPAQEVGRNEHNETEAVRDAIELPRIL